MTDIKTLVPQRDPFLFVDEIISANMEEIVGIKTYDKSFLFCEGHFPERKIVPGVILIESIVQCGGAGVTKLGIFENVLWGLASIDHVQFWGIIEPGTTIKMVVKNLKLSNKVLKQTGTAFCEEKAILEATWLCLRLK